MSGRNLPFHTQAALLEAYAHQDDPQADPVALEIIRDVLQRRPDLRTYFFRRRPNPSWVPILWDWGFFSQPPEPDQTPDGYRLPEWAEQAWLLSIAPAVPDFVIKHVQGIRGHGRYVSEAVKALTLIPADQATQAVTKVVEVLRERSLASWIATEAFDVVKHLASYQQLDGALMIFRELTAPLQAQNTTNIGSYVSGAEAVSKFGRDWNEQEILEESLGIFRQQALPSLIQILEDQLVAALQLEAASQHIPEAGLRTYWRSAIETSSQNVHRKYKDQLLSTLRDAMETLVAQDARAAQTIIERYLQGSSEILQRLGLHLLRRFPAQFRPMVWQELQRQETLEAVGLHHEVFLLLQDGYPHLVPEQQAAIVAIIQKGPSDGLLTRMAAWVAQQYDEVDLNAYMERFKKRWIRDRLWMLRKHLVGTAQQQLQGLLADVGTPEHPEFTFWSSGASFVQEVSPLQEADLSQMTPQALLDFLQSWQPPADQDWVAARISYRGLAQGVTAVIVADMPYYRDVINDIAGLRPEFAYELLHRLREQEDTPPATWDIQLGMCEALLSDPAIRSNMERSFETNWPDARHAIVDLIQKDLDRPQLSVPEQYLPRIRNLLLILIDDPDPDLESDQPGEGWFGHDDPATIAINHVRSDALIGLIQYAHTRAVIQQEPHDERGPRPKHLEPVVEAALSRKLDRGADPSRAVHSVYGKCLHLLYQLDRDWLETHLDVIFPEESDPLSESLFVAAWDSYVLFNQALHKPLFDLLRPKYQRAINNLERGLVSKTHLDPARSFGSHVLLDYLDGSYDLRSPEGQTSLIASFFSQAPAEARKSLLWLIWRRYQANHAGFAKIWPRIRQLWEWRAHRASSQDHAAEFDAEMEMFARLLSLVADRETMGSLWPLLESLIPHVARGDHRNSGWNALEKYLAQQVLHDPVRVIKLYRLMQQHIGNARSFFFSDEAQTIIQTTAADVRSRQDTLALIDDLARAGVYRYQDVYDRYA